MKSKEFRQPKGRFRLLVFHTEPINQDLLSKEAVDKLIEDSHVGITVINPNATYDEMPYALSESNALLLLIRLKARHVFDPENRKKVDEKILAAVDKIIEENPAMRDLPSAAERLFQVMPTASKPLPAAAPAR